MDNGVKEENGLTGTVRDSKLSPLTPLCGVLSGLLSRPLLRKDMQRAYTMFTSAYLHLGTDPRCGVKSTDISDTSRRAQSGMSNYSIMCRRDTDCRLLVKRRDSTSTHRDERSG